MTRVINFIYHSSARDTHQRLGFDEILIYCIHFCVHSCVCVYVFVFVSIQSKIIKREIGDTDIRQHTILLYTMCANINLLYTSLLEKKQKMSYFVYLPTKKKKKQRTIKIPKTYVYSSVLVFNLKVG